MSNKSDKNSNTIPHIDMDRMASLLLNNMSVGLIAVRVSDDFELISANKYFYEMFETEESDYSDGLFSRFGATDRLMYSNYLKNQILGGLDPTLEFKSSRKKSGEILWVKAEAKHVSKETPNIFVAVLTDITKEKQLSSELEEIKNLYLKAISSSDEMIFEYHVRDDIFVYYKLVEEEGVIINKANVRTMFLSNLEHSKDVYPDDAVYFADLCRDNITHPFDVRFRRSNQKPGEYTRMRVHATIQKEDGDNVSRIIGTIRPIETIKTNEELIAINTDKDELTGVYSKSKAKVCVEEYLSNSSVASSFALLILDINGFKVVNETFGHMFGDNVLVQVADTIIENTKHNDIVGRIGGDEFMILVKNASKSSVESICDKICRGVRNIYVGEDIVIDASIGGIVVKDKNKTYDELFRTADNALFELVNTKKKGYFITDTVVAITKKGLKHSYVADRNVRNVTGSKEKRLSELIFELLEQAKDVDRALDTVLALIGEKKNLSRISILRRDGNKLLVTKQWLARGIRPSTDFNTETFEDYAEKMQHNFEEDGMGIVNLETAERYAPDKVQEILSGEAKSIMYCNMMEFGEVVGTIAYVDCNEEREWTDIDYKAYRTLTRMISAYTLKTEAIKKIQ